MVLANCQLVRGKYYRLIGTTGTDAKFIGSVAQYVSVAQYIGGTKEFVGHMRTVYASDLKLVREWPVQEHDVFEEVSEEEVTALELSDALVQYRRVHDE